VTGWVVRPGVKGCNLKAQGKQAIIIRGYAQCMAQLLKQDERTVTSCSSQILNKKSGRASGRTSGRRTRHTHPQPLADVAISHPQAIPIHRPTLAPAPPPLPYSQLEHREGEGPKRLCRTSWVALEAEETPRRGNRRRGGKYNTRSTFETFRCNTCNIWLKTDETLETWV
jgi:hypothetical protein